MQGGNGEGCSLFGSVQVPRVPATLRIVPARHVEEGRLSYMPDLHVRHALYFNVSHSVRHLSFGTYFPGQRNPLDATSRVYTEGTAEARYLVQAPPRSGAA